MPLSKILRGRAGLQSENASGLSGAMKLLASLPRAGRRKPQPQGVCLKGRALSFMNCLSYVHVLSHHFSENLFRISLGVENTFCPVPRPCNHKAGSLWPNRNLLALDTVYCWRKPTSGFTVKRVRKLYERAQKTHGHQIVLTKPML